MQTPASSKSLRCPTSREEKSGARGNPGRSLLPQQAVQSSFWGVQTHRTSPEGCTCLEKAHGFCSPALISIHAHRAVMLPCSFMSCGC